MPTIEHNVLSGGDLHEPKGVAGASANQVYAANGSGSGAWSTLYLQGWEDYNDSGSSQPLSTVPTYTDLSNDGLNTYTSTAYRLPGRTAIWDTANNQFDFSSLNLGDTVDIRLDFNITTTSASNDISYGLDLAHGDATEYRLIFNTNTYKAAGTHGSINWIGIYMGNLATLNNPAKIIMASDAAGDSVVFNGLYARVTPRIPVLG